MTMHFIREVENLKREILALGGLVEESVQKAVRSVTSKAITSASITRASCAAPGKFERIFLLEYLSRLQPGYGAARAQNVDMV